MPTSPITAMQYNEQEERGCEMRSDYRDPTLSELLEDPLVLLLMTRDGVARGDIEMLMTVIQSRAEIDPDNLLTTNNRQSC